MTGSRPVTPRVLILGWGFLGGAIGERLLADGMTVTGLTRSQTWRTEAARAAGARIVVGDAHQAAVLDSALREVDHVVYSIGGHTPGGAAAHPSEAALAMLLPLIAVLEALHERPHVSLTYMSSGGAVYGNPVRLPVRETDAARPISPYGASHLAAEGYAQMSARRSGSMLQIVRCSNVYGPYQPHGRDQGVVAIFLDRISKGVPIQIFGDGSALLDYVYVGDIADAVSRIVAGGVDTGTINLGSGVGLTVLEIAHAISAAAGKDAIIDHQPERSFDIRSSVLDISRARSLLDYSPRDFAYGLTATVAAYLQGARGQSLDQSTLVNR
jgi:UDP-glucose 4-epimerase